MTDHNRLRELARAATPGPWHFSRESWNVSVAHHDTVVDIAVYQPEDDADTTGEFIAAANPAAILELLDRLSAAERERDAIKAEALKLYERRLQWRKETFPDHAMKQDAVLAAEYPKVAAIRALAEQQQTTTQELEGEGDDVTGN